MDKKRANFVRLAEKRVNRAIEDVRLIGNLSNSSNYEYTNDDVEKITRVLTDEIGKMKRRFHNQGVGGNAKFAL